MLSRDLGWIVLIHACGLIGVFLGRARHSAFWKSLLIGIVFMSAGFTIPLPEFSEDDLALQFLVSFVVSAVAAVTVASLLRIGIPIGIRIVVYCLAGMAVFGWLFPELP